MSDKSFIFICGAGRSGTTLLSNLLDGHPDICSIPHETQFAAQWFRNKFLGIPDDQNKLLNINSGSCYQFTDPSYVKAHNGYLMARFKSANLKSFTIDEKILKQASQDLAKCTDGLSSLYLYLWQIYAGTTGETKKKYVVEKRPLDNEICAMSLKKSFPEAKFIHILRDPRTRYLSAKIRRRLKRRRYITNLKDQPFSIGHAEVSMASLELAHLNRSVLPDDYLVIRYEDLITDSQSSMQSIANFFGISFNKILLEQTIYNGSPATALSSIPEKSPDLEKTAIVNNLENRLTKYFNNTTVLEQKIVSLYCRDAAARFGYSLEQEQPVNLLDILIGEKYASPFTMLQNRLFLFNALVKNHSYGSMKRKCSRDFANIVAQFFQGNSIPD